MSDKEMESIRQQAESEQLSVGEYVRRTLREADSHRPAKSPGVKLAIIRKAAKSSFPTANIDQMNREIERGYRS